MTVTETGLEQAGYKMHTSPSGFLRDCDCLWQKWIWSEDGQTKLYCLNVYTYRSLPHGVGFQPEIDFYYEHDRFSTRLVLLTRADTSIEDIEAHAREFFEKMSCVPDKHNND